VRQAWAAHRELRRREREPVVCAPPRSARVLVLSPHMDDETFGCGGTLALAVEAGCEVSVVFLTDGARGYDPRLVAGWPRADIERHEARLVGVRQAEARAAGAVLGLGEPVFLGLPDGRAAEARDAGARLADVIRRLIPDIVFLPFLSDPHPDHAATNRIFVEACARGALPRGATCWGYEVWSPLVANTLVDIGAAMARKREAMQAYRSQSRDVDYPRVVEGLNAYRSLAAGCSRGYAEAFYVARSARYCELFESVFGRASVSSTKSRMPRAISVQE
jgi:LmbE family N-acetylglucosaminyl deacetylase